MPNIISWTLQLLENLGQRRLLRVRSAGSQSWREAMAAEL